MGTPIYWLSFADDSGHLGCCIVEATDFLSAVSISHVRGCNPGGECQGWELPADAPEVKAEVARWGLGRLITKAEMLAAGDFVRASDGQPLTATTTVAG